MTAIVITMVSEKPVRVDWSLEDTQAVMVESNDGQVSFLSLELPPLSNVIQRYFHFRGLKMPSREQAFLFLTSELGELADELVQQAGGWVRNNPQDKGKGIPSEASDVLMMLLVFAMQSTPAFDPLEALFDKLAAKGFPLNASRQKGGEEE